MSFQYKAPGLLEEFDPTWRQHWHDYILDQMRGSAKPPSVYPDGTQVFNAGSRNQFFIEADTPLQADAVEETVGWTVFPRNTAIESASDEERWRTAESMRDLQEEYCEWSVKKDANGKIREISFTCEDRDYWAYLWAQDRSKVLDLYRKHISASVELDDLHDGNYNYMPANKWNRDSTNGAMHMISGPNTIGAAIELVAAACVIRLNADGSPKTGDREVTRCGKFADAERHSDPSIYGKVNAFARDKHFISMRNAPELAFESISFAGWELPGEEDPSKYWHYTRGKEGHYVRAVYAVPEEAGFEIGDIKIDGSPIRYGAQLADKIRVKVTAVAHRLGTAETEPLSTCTVFRRPQAALPLSSMTGIAALAPHNYQR